MIVAAMRRMDRRILSVILRRNRYCAHKSTPKTVRVIVPTSSKEHEGLSFSKKEGPPPETGRSSSHWPPVVNVA